MSVSHLDGLDLLVPLYEGAIEEPRWATFLARLQRRVRADHVVLVRGRNDAADPDEVRCFTRVGLRDRAFVPAAAGLRHLRPGRIYSDADMVGTTCDHGLVLRVAASDTRSLWLGVARAAMAFSAADGALLSSLAVHLAIAARTLSRLETARVRLAAADEACRRAGIGWQLVEGDAPVPENGGVAVAAPGDVPGHRVILTRSPPPLGAPCAVLLARQFGLSPAEARLAVCLANGSSLIEAGAALGLSRETARTYSKRLFAKTGTRGQGDLVRQVLGSAATLV